MGILGDVAVFLPRHVAQKGAGAAGHPDPICSPAGKRRLETSRVADV
jgi:hypothetical protein